jgi:nucleoside-diphosphate-sugar epimerase
LSADGAQVRAITRSTRAPEGAVLATVRDLHDRDGLGRALDGADAVVHLAARVHVMRETAADPDAEFRRVNVDGTAELFDAAQKAGVATFLFISSVKAVGEQTDSAWTSATAAAPGDPYGRSKHEAETLIRRHHGACLIRAPILRLPLVYGPGMRGNMLRLFDLVRRGMPLPFGRVRNRRSLAYVGNVVAAVRGVLGVPAATDTYFVSDGEDLSTAELVRRIARALDCSARLVPVPEAFLRALGRGGDALERVMPCPITTAALDRLFGSLVIDASPLAELVGAPPFTVDQGLAATAAWFRARKAAGADA